MVRQMIVAVALVLVLGTAVPVVVQVPVVQQAVVTYLTSLPADWNAMSPAALKSRLDAGEKIFLLDVREPHEFADGHIPAAVNVPIRTLVANLDKLPAAKDAVIVVVCGSALRAAYGTMALSMLGYSNVKDMSSGMTGWVTQGFPVVK